ncbi:hypothetical protein QBC43DRAFT_359331 [Cladorrhinum sp. PSN259]|nr:hypothetical protein QBC43DRAFT_359331 [Cladorrhinum sp. PSN259]
MPPKKKTAKQKQRRRNKIAQRQARANKDDDKGKGKEEEELSSAGATPADLPDPEEPQSPSVTAEMAKQQMLQLLSGLALGGLSGEEEQEEEKQEEEKQEEEGEQGGEEEEEEDDDDDAQGLPNSLYSLNLGAENADIENPPQREQLRAKYHGEDPNLSWTLRLSNRYMAVPEFFQAAVMDLKNAGNEEFVNDNREAFDYQHMLFFLPGWKSDKLGDKDFFLSVIEEEWDKLVNPKEAGENAYAIQLGRDFWENDELVKRMKGDNRTVWLNADAFILTGTMHESFVNERILKQASQLQALEFRESLKAALKERDEETEAKKRAWLEVLEKDEASDKTKAEFVRKVEQLETKLSVYINNEKRAAEAAAEERERAKERAAEDRDVIMTDYPVQPLGRSRSDAGPRIQTRSTSDARVQTRTPTPPPAPPAPAAAPAPAPAAAAAATPSPSPAPEPAISQEPLPMPFGSLENANYRLTDLRMRTIDRLVSVPKSSNKPNMETQAMAQVKNKLNSKYPPYPGGRDRRYEDRIALINTWVHGGDLREDCRMIVNNSIKIRHDDERNEYFRLGFEQVYGIPPSYAKSILAALDHEDDAVRKLVWDCAKLVDKYVSARDKEVEEIKRRHDQGVYSTAQRANALKRITNSDWRYDVFASDFARFCANPNIKDARKVDNLKRMRWKVYEEVQPQTKPARGWLFYKQSWERASEWALNQRKYAFWNPPHSDVVEYLEYNPPRA